MGNVVLCRHSLIHGVPMLCPGIIHDLAIHHALISLNKICYSRRVAEKVGQHQKKNRLLMADKRWRERYTELSCWVNDYSTTRVLHQKEGVRNMPLGGKFHQYSFPPSPKNNIAAANKHWSLHATEQSQRMKQLSSCYNKVNTLKFIVT